LIGLRAGAVWVTVSKADTVLRRRIEVLPAVATFSWEPVVTAARVGDTIRARAVARDSAGGFVKALGAHSRVAGAGSAEVSTLRWSGPDGTVVVPSSPGVLELRTTLGARTAVLRATILPRE
jgi:hypothetical protein